MEVEKMTLEEMLIKIAETKYKALGFPYVFLDYSHTFKKWSVTWRNPVNFTNEEVNTESDTPTEACVKALKFIKQRKTLTKNQK